MWATFFSTKSNGKSQLCQETFKKKKEIKDGEEISDDWVRMLGMCVRKVGKKLPVAELQNS